MSTKKIIHLILGNQLFFDKTLFVDSANVDFLLLESIEISSRYKYHKYKLAFIFNWMREFKKWLSQNFSASRVYYYEINQNKKFEDIFSFISNEYSILRVFKIVDKSFEFHLLGLAKNYFSNIEIVQTPYFINSESDNKIFIESQKNKFLHHNFYVFQRKRLGILLERGQKPFLKKWSFDKENRKKIPKNLYIDNSNLYFTSQIYSTVCRDVNMFFQNNPGDLKEVSWLPLNLDQLDRFVDEFFQKRFDNFGPYEDAISNKDFLLFHSGFSALLNLGIITPRDIINRLNRYLIDKYNLNIYDELSVENLEVQTIPIFSIEGFIRQIIGWREFINLVYTQVYDSDLAKYNFFNHTSQLPDYFWNFKLNNDVQINTPLSSVLSKINKYAYCHHIERLMVLSNWMVLNEYSPLECYKWFMTMFIDAYEWVMVPNVFGMGLFADGGLFATKPYIAGGNYLKKMSDYSDYKNWEEIWSTLFWKFISKHREFFKKQQLSLIHI